MRDYDRNNKYITKKFNWFTSDGFAAGLKQANLVSKNDADDFVKKTGFDDKLEDVNKKS